MSGSARAGTISREAYLRAVILNRCNARSHERAPEICAFLLTDDLHGSRQTAPYALELEPDIVLTQPHASGVDETCTPLGDLWLTCMTQFVTAFLRREE